MMNEYPKFYRKKPVVIQAMQWTGNNYVDICDFLNYEPDLVHDDTGLKEALVIETLEGPMKGRKGSYIVRGISGEFYPVKSDIFEATYDEV
jgi:hypothetical protein